MESRTENSLKNIKFAIIGQFAGIIISLFSRFIFIKILSSEYLGLSSLFSNVLSILSLAEMGFGTAIAYELYRPLSTNDFESIKSLMHFYKKIYTIIGFTMIALGIITIPIYPLLIKQLPNIPNINFIYLLFVFNSAFSYFLAYKRILLISNQKKYIDTIYKYGFYFILNIIQIIILYLFKNYLFFLIVQVFMTFLENIFVSLKVNEIYPYLLENNYKSLSKNKKNSIFNNVKAMFSHKIGGVVLNSTDNIVISKYINLNAVGLYSNYYLITSALDKVINQFFSSLIASIGNLDVTCSVNKKTSIYKKIFFFNFFIYTIYTSCLLNLLNPFIKLWLGDKYLLNNFTIIILVINQYIYGMRRTSMAFRESTGNYSTDWFSPIIEALINIFVSIILAKKIGIAGVFLGTIISSLCTNFWLEPLVVCRKTLNINLKNYFVLYFQYMMFVLISCLISLILCRIFNELTYFNFFIKLLISTFVPLFLFIITFSKNDNFIFYKNFLIKKLRK